jgi:serine/threonine-protein kinase
MGAVYGAHHERLGRRAAIKVISPSLSRDRDAIERFEQEAKALARISHPNIVGVLNVGTLPGDGRAYFVMEWLDGESLQARLDRGAIGLGPALYILDQIARGLEAAHAAGIVHRDLKPDNVWLQHVADEPRPIVKILDWGLAKLLQHQRTEHTAVNVMFGTAAYMSPEQCRSARDVGPATDVYALSCIGYQLLCGRLPFPYDNAAELVAAHLNEDPPRPLSLNPSIDPTLDTLLAAMVAKVLVQRPTLSRVRSVIASARPLPRTPARPPTNAARPRPPTSAAQPGPPQPNSPPRAAPARRASTALVHEKYASRRVVVALGGLVVLGVVIAAAVAKSGRASRRMTDEPRSAIEIDGSVAPIATAAPSFVRDASMPLAMPAPRVDARTAPPRSNVDPDSPPVTRQLLDGGAQESMPTVVIEPDPRPATEDTMTVDASVEPDTAKIEPAPGDAAVEVDVAVTPAKTAPSSHRTPPPTAKKPPQRDGTPPVPAAKKPPQRDGTPVPAVKRPPDRDVITNPFKKKPITK